MNVAKILTEQFKPLDFTLNYRINELTKYLEAVNSNY